MNIYTVFVLFRAVTVHKHDYTSVLEKGYQNVLAFVDRVVFSSLCFFFLFRYSTLKSM